MTTAYAPGKVNEKHWIDPAKRHQIPSTSQQIIPEDDKIGLLGEPDPRIKWWKGLPVPAIIYEYNTNMNGIDRIAQMVAYYYDERRNRRYWISLFEFLLMAAVINAYRLYKEHHRNKQVIDHSTFQREIAIALLKRSHSRRRLEPNLKVVDQDPLEPEYY